MVNGWSGLKEYIGANPALKVESVTTVIHSKISDVSLSNGEFEEDSEVQDEFYDAIAADSSSSSEDEGSDNDEEHDKKVFSFLPLSR